MFLELCFGFLLFLLGIAELPVPFKGFTLRVNLAPSLQFLSPWLCSHPDKLGSDNQETNTSQGWDVTGLFAFPRSLCPRDAAVGGGWEPAGGFPTVWHCFPRPVATLCDPEEGPSPA